MQRKMSKNNRILQNKCCREMKRKANGEFALCAEKSQKL